MAAKSKPVPGSQSTQAKRIIARFGTAYELSRALADLEEPEHARTPAAIYRWTYPRARGGQDGLIPSDMLRAIQDAARLHGIVIPDTEWRP